MEQHSIKVIARIRSDFKTKFGVPRQSGLVEALRARIVFEPEYRNADALRGILHPHGDALAHILRAAVDMLLQAFCRRLTIELQHKGLHLINGGICARPGVEHRRPRHKKLIAASARQCCARGQFKA